MSDHAGIARMLNSDVERAEEHLTHCQQKLDSKNREIALISTEIAQHQVWLDNLRAARDVLIEAASTEKPSIGVA